MPETNYGDLKVQVPVNADEPIDLEAFFKHFADSVIVPSSRLKQTTGKKIGTGGNIILGEAFQDIPGTTLELKPSVPSYLRVWAVFALAAQCQGESLPAQALGTLNVDGKDQTEPVADLSVQTVAGGATSVINGVSVPANYIIALTAAAHTIKLRAKRNSGYYANVTPVLSHFIYDLVAQ